MEYWVFSKVIVKSRWNIVGNWGQLQPLRRVRMIDGSVRVNGWSFGIVDG